MLVCGNVMPLFKNFLHPNRDFLCLKGDRIISYQLKQQMRHKNLKEAETYSNRLIRELI